MCQRAQLRSHGIGRLYAPSSAWSVEVYGPESLTWMRYMSSEQAAGAWVVKSISTVTKQGLLPNP